VNVHDGFPAAASIARWQQDGQRWLAAARKTTRVVCGGSAWKLDALAETLTFHAHGDAIVRGRDAVQWLAQASVRVLEGAVRGARGAAPEGGVEAGLLVSRAIDRETGQTLSVDYVLCDPALAGEGARVVQWARWAEDGDTRCRTLRHALDHLGAASHAGTAEAQACANLIALQAGVTALRLEGASTQVAVAFLARLAGRSAAKGTQPGGAALVEGIGRLLALLDVLENYPGRKARVVQAAPHPAPQAVDADAGASHRGDALRVAMAHPPTHAEAAQHLAQRLAHHGQLQASAQAPASASPTSTFVPVLPQLASLGTES
jgi:flagellar biosynthesis protein FlhF